MAGWNASRSRTGEACAIPKSCCGCCARSWTPWPIRWTPVSVSDVIRLEALLAEETKPATISFDSDENARQQIQFPDRPAVGSGSASIRVQRFVPQDTHIPEAASVAVPAQDRDFSAQDWPLKRQPGRSAAQAACGFWKRRKKLLRCCRWRRMVRRNVSVGGVLISTWPRAGRS